MGDRRRKRTIDVPENAKKLMNNDVEYSEAKVRLEINNMKSKI